MSAAPEQPLKNEAHAKKAVPNHGNAIALNDVKYHYADSNSSGLHIPTWKVNYGDRVFLHGHSGSGKTTLLNLLAGVLTPQSGELSLLLSLIHI